MYEYANLMARKDIPDHLVAMAYMAAKNVNMARYPYDYLMEWTDEPFKVCYRAMEQASERGYIDWGVSLRTGWLTDDGRQLLAKR